MSFLVCNYFAKENIAGCGAVGLSVLCDYSIPWSYTHFLTPTKRSDAQPLVEREKQFKCCPVEISRS